jgi:hypothetical protein
MSTTRAASRGPARRPPQSSSIPAIGARGWPPCSSRHALTLGCPRLEQGIVSGLPVCDCRRVRRTLDSEGFHTVSSRQKTYGPLGCQLGCVSAILLYFYPLPVGLIVWLFELNGLFADYMYVALLVFALLPFAGYAIGARYSRPASTEEKPESPTTGSSHPD